MIMDQAHPNTKAVVVDYILENKTNWERIVVFVSDTKSEFKSNIVRDRELFHSKRTEYHLSQNAVIDYNLTVLEWE